MIQVEHRIAGTLSACAHGHQPKHIEVRGKGQHFLECAPCQVRTAKFPSLQEAVEAWEKQHINAYVERAA